MRGSEVKRGLRNRKDRSIVRKTAKEKDGEERTWQRADLTRSLVVTSCSNCMQWRMLGAAVLKGTGVTLMREDWVSYSTAWCHKYRVGRVLLHSTGPVIVGWHGCVCAVRKDGEVMGAFQPQGGNLKCLRRRREEKGVEESRTETLSSLSRGGWCVWEGRQRWKKHKPPIPHCRI